MAASTYVFYDGSINGQEIPAQHTLEDNILTVRRVIVDFSKQNLDAGEGDVAQVIPVEAGTFVMTAWLRVITAETANGTCDLGYGGNVDEWGDALALDSAADSVLGAINDWVPVYFAADDTIDIVATTDTADVDLDGAKVEVVAVLLKVVKSL